MKPEPAALGRISAHQLYSETPEQEEFFMHTHVRYEIYCFLEGDAYYTVEGTRYELEPGDLLLLCPGEVHHVVFRSPAPYRRIVVNFNDLAPLPEELADRLLRPFHDRVFGTFNRYAVSAFPEWDFGANLRALCEKRDPLTAYTLLLALLGMLGEAFRTLKTDGQASAEQDSRLGARIIAYLTTHLTEPISLDDLTAHFYLSKTHLNRVFREATGATIWKYVMTKRLFLCREMMQRGMRASEAALRAGFKDYSTFYRAYRSHFGETPKTLRENRKRES